MMGPKKWTIPAPKVSLVVKMADMLASNEQNSQLVTYSLGSCVGISVYDPVVKVGGLLHALLPDSSINPERARGNPFTFVDTGLPALFHAVYALGGVKWRLIVKLAGGAEVFEGNKLFGIGRRNIEAAESILCRNGVVVQGRDVGGKEIRTFRMEMASGDVTLDINGKGTRVL